MIDLGGAFSFQLLGIAENRRKGYNGEDENEKCQFFGPFLWNRKSKRWEKVL